MYHIDSWYSHACTYLSMPVVSRVRVARFGVRLKFVINDSRTNPESRRLAQAGTLDEPSYLTPLPVKIVKYRSRLLP